MGVRNILNENNAETVNRFLWNYVYRSLYIYIYIVRYAFNGFMRAGDCAFRIVNIINYVYRMCIIINKMFVTLSCNNGIDNIFAYAEKGNRGPTLVYNRLSNMGTTRYYFSKYL